MLKALGSFLFPLPFGFKGHWLFALAFWFKELLAFSACFFFFFIFCHFFSFFRRLCVFHCFFLLQESILWFFKLSITFLFFHHSFKSQHSWTTNSKDICTVQAYNQKSKVLPPHQNNYINCYKIWNSCNSSLFQLRTFFIQERWWIHRTFITLRHRH